MEECTFTKGRKAEGIVANWREMVLGRLTHVMGDVIRDPESLRNRCIHHDQKSSKYIPQQEVWLSLSTLNGECNEVSVRGYRRDL